MKHNIATSAIIQRTVHTFTIASTCFSVLFFVWAASTAQGMLSQSRTIVGDPQRGQELFEKRCGGCHSLDKDKEGPRLRDVYGRKAGSIQSFKYSDSLKSAEIIWNDDSLDKWLINTDSVVPDNDMDFHVTKPNERADIIQFLRVSSGK